MANVVLAAAAVGAAVVVLRVPALRKMAFGLAATALSTHVPAWLKQEASRAWHTAPASAPSTRAGHDGGARSGQGLS